MDVNNITPEILSSTDIEQLSDLFNIPLISCCSKDELSSFKPYNGCYVINLMDAVVVVVIGFLYLFNLVKQFILILLDKFILMMFKNLFIIKKLFTTLILFKILINNLVVIIVLIFFIK